MLDAVLLTLCFSSAWQAFGLPPTAIGTTKNATIKTMIAPATILSIHNPLV
jgi:hypothetical protein